MTILHVTDSRERLIAQDIEVGDACTFESNPTKVYQKIKIEGNILTLINLGYIPFIEQPSGRLVAMTPEGIIVLPVALEIHATILDVPSQQVSEQEIQQRADEAGLRAVLGFDSIGM